MKIDEARIERAMSMALLDSVQLLQNNIIKITPRDPKRLPKDPSKKVTGNLKRSIDYEKVSKFEFKIGTKQSEAEYGKFQEFGTPHLAPRSFLRKGIIDSKDEVLKNFKKRFGQALG